MENRRETGRASGTVYYQLPLLCVARAEGGREVTACIRITLKLDSEELRNAVEQRRESVDDVVREVLRHAPESALNNVEEYEAVRNGIMTKMQRLPGMSGVSGVLIHELSFRNR